MSTKKVEITKYVWDGMKLSTRGRYGVRLMVELAAHYGKGPTLLTDIATRQNISQKYLGHLISPLKEKGLIRSVRGVRGGYLLAKDPNDITLRDVLEVVEGSLCLVDCVENSSVCERAATCIFRDVWGETSKMIARTLEATTLFHLVKRQKAKRITNHDATL